MYTQDNFHKVEEIVENRRAAARAAADARTLEVRARSKRIAEIDAELSKTGLLLFRTACAGGDVAAVRARNEELQTARRAELSLLGLPEDYTEVRYTCPLCQDTGFIDTKMCSCFRELLLTENIRSSGMGTLIEKQSFENFDLSWYSSDPDLLRRAEHNLKTARAFADEFPNAKDKNLLFIGKTGTGKTHLSTAIAREVIARGYDVLYDTAQNIVAAFEQDHFRSGYGTYDPKGDKYLDCDLLILDDLGTEFVNAFTVSCLYNLFNTRQNRGLSTIVSTNLSPDELSRKYEDRIYSRIVGSDYTVLLFGGKDHRIYR